MTYTPGDSSLLLAIDTGSPVTSVALATPDKILVLEKRNAPRSSSALMPLIESALSTAGAELRDLSQVVALRGPGSFTGLRVGLATVLGLHQALGLQATAISTLEVLASISPEDKTIVAGAVDALRGDWFTQRFATPTPRTAREDASLIRPSELGKWEADTVVGFDVEGAFRPFVGPGTELIEPDELASSIVQFSRTHKIDWDPETLTAPSYLRPPAIHIQRPASQRTVATDKRSRDA